MMKLDILTDASGNSLSPIFSPPILSSTFVSVLIISAVTLICWPWNPLYSYISQNNIPQLFFVVSSATLIVNSYLNLRCGRGEMIKKNAYHPQHEKLPTFEEKNDFVRYTLIVFLLQSLFLLAPSFPLLILGGAISAVTLTTFAKAAFIIFSASLLCRMFGFMTYLFGGRSSSWGYFSARIFIFVFLVGTLAFGRAVNPIRILYELNNPMPTVAFPFMNSYYVYTAAAIPVLLILAAVNQRLVKGRLSREKRH